MFMFNLKCAFHFQIIYVFIYKLYQHKLASDQTWIDIIVTKKIDLCMCVCVCV